MEDEFLRNEIMGIYSKYDPDLAASVALDELGRIIVAAFGYQDGYTRPMMEEGDAWHSGPPTVSNKYSRALVCLGKAVRDEFGDAYVFRPGRENGTLIHANIDTGRVCLLDKARSGMHAARVYCAIHFYIQALKDLSQYPEAKKRDILKSLEKAHDVLPCPDVEIAIQRVNELYSRHRGRMRAILVRGLRVALFLAGISLAVFLPSSLPPENPLEAVTPPVESVAPQVYRQEIASSAPHIESSVPTRNADAIFEQFHTAISSALQRDDIAEIVRLYNQMIEEASRNGFSLDAFREALSSVVDQRSLEYYETIDEYFSGKYSRLPTFSGFVTSELLSTSGGKPNRHHVVSDSGSLMLLSDYETLVINSVDGGIEHLRSYTGLTCEFLYSRNSDDSRNYIRVARILKTPEESLLQSKIHDSMANPGFITVKLPMEKESKPAPKSKPRRNRYISRMSSFGPPPRDSL